jgi:hypothetical protein
MMWTPNPACVRNRPLGHEGCSLWRALLCFVIYGSASCGTSPRGDADAGANGADDGAQESDDDGSDSSDDDTTGDGDDDDVNELCAKIDARPRPKATAVWFVINPVSLDGRLVSGDNTQEITNGQMFRELLFGTSGVVTQLDATIQFGLGSHIGDLLQGCPSGLFVPAALHKAEELADAYENLPAGQGTTWASLDMIAKEIEKRSEPIQDTIVLIQSSHGDAGCDPFVLGPDKQRTAVERVAGLGARVSVVTLLHAPGRARLAWSSPPWGMARRSPPTRPLPFARPSKALSPTRSAARSAWRVSSSKARSALARCCSRVRASVVTSPTASDSSTRGRSS